MPNIFRSKEVYKKISREIHNGNSMVPVRGVYVSGEYRPPYYQNPIIRITDIETTKPKIANFTSENVEASTTDTVGVLGFSSGPITHIQRFTKEYKDAPSTDTVGVLGFSVGSLNITKFSRDYIDATTTDTVGVLGYDVSNLSIIHMLKRYHNQAPEPSLRLTTIQTSPAMIEKYNG